MQKIEFIWNYVKADSQPAGAAVKKREVYIANNLSFEARYPEWSGDAVKTGFKSAMVFPLTTPDGIIKGCITLYSAEQNFFSEKKWKCSVCLWAMLRFL